MLQNTQLIVIITSKPSKIGHKNRAKFDGFCLSMLECKHEKELGGIKMKRLY